MSEAAKRLSRRTLFAGASAAGAIAAVATVLPRSQVTAPPDASIPKQMPEKGGGYTLSEHVKRYYGTTRV